ncbi:MAG: HAMP domain-containing sensor histidine kinase, partial [Dehalococcoidia bacterium]
HELRTPMTTILGFSELLMDEITEGPTRRWVEHLFDDSLRLTGILDEMLDVSRIQSGRIKLNIQRLDTAAVVGEVLKGVAPTTDTHEFDVRMAPDLPMVLADHDKLTQVLLNLVSNAVKYSPNGGRVTIGATPSDNREEVIIKITDTGIGIAEEDLELIFETFHRVRNAETERIRGTGLGLYIVKSLVEGMEGRIEVDSEPGKGSAFTVVLPSSRTDDAKSWREAHGEQGSTSR